MDRVTGLSVFAKVVESSSFAAAARHFGLSPAMVSKHILALEERLGARLLNRTTRRVSPTEIGRVFYERATRILADMDDPAALPDQERAEESVGTAEHREPQRDLACLRREHARTAGRTRLRTSAAARLSAATSNPAPK